jgi:pSer/pThr/pTyr-binding forkhead associated (FHA) protein
MHLILEVVSGPARGKRIEANPGQTVSIGRTKKANIALGDDFMSGAHFAVECGTENCHVRDLKSRNGTKLNGKLIIEAVLTDGDRLFAGHTDFVARIQTAVSNVTAKRSISKAGATEKRRRKVSQKPSPAATPEVKRTDKAQLTSAQPHATEAKFAPPPKPEPPPSPPRQKSPEAPRAQPISPSAIESYEAVTPQGRLLQILSNQSQTVLALLDAVRDTKVLELLKASREEYQSLYGTNQNPAIAPYLVRLPPRSELLKQMIQLGWGHEWGVYLTCPASVGELRQYFRTSLMVTLPDGVELLSRFYDPRFFRRFLENCSLDDAEKFFGPVTSYFMEDERPEILLQFTRTQRGVEKSGHLLSDFA